MQSTNCSLSGRTETMSHEDRIDEKVLVRRSRDAGVAAARGTRAPRRIVSGCRARRRLGSIFGEGAAAVTIDIDVDVDVDVDVDGDAWLRATGVADLHSLHRGAVVAAAVAAAEVAAAPISSDPLGDAWPAATSAGHARNLGRVVDGAASIPSGRRVASPPQRGVAAHRAWRRRRPRVAAARPREARHCAPDLRPPVRRRRPSRPHPNALDQAIGSLSPADLDRRTRSLTIEQWQVRPTS
jgi:hypothetical protein